MLDPVQLLESETGLLVGYNSYSFPDLLDSGCLFWIQNGGRLKENKDM